MECATVRLARVRIHPRDVGCARRLARWFTWHDCVPAQDRQVDIQVQVCSRADSFHCRNFGLASLALTIQATFNKEQTPHRETQWPCVNFYERHIEQDDRAGAQPQLAGDQHSHASRTRSARWRRTSPPRSKSSLAMVPVRKHSALSTWDEWITLPIRDGDNAVRTVRGAIRVPTVIVAVNYRQRAEEAPEALRPQHPRARRQPLPIHRRVAAPGRRQPRPRRAPLARRPGHVGKPRVVEQAGEHPQGQPPAARSRPEAAQGAARAEGTAGVGAHPQRPRRRGMETVPE